MRDLSTFDIIDLRRFSEEECNQHTESETLPLKNIPQINIELNLNANIHYFQTGGAHAYPERQCSRFCLLPEACTVSQKHFKTEYFFRLCGIQFQTRENS